MLNIIVPQYNENDDIVYNLLKSINAQEDVDFNKIEIVIVNDNSNTLLSNELFHKFEKLNIKYLIKPTNDGPGITRQYGIDNSNKDYIMFMDADDELIGKNSLKKIFELLNSKKPDCLLFGFLEESIYNNKKVIISHKPDMTYLHAKIFKRSHLINNNFRFHDKLRVHEDSYFNTLVLMNTKNIVISDKNIYLWKYNKNSLTKKKEEYHYLVRTFDDLIDSMMYLKEELEKRNTNKREEYIIKSVFFLYFLDQSKYFKAKNDLVLTELKKKFEKRIYDVLLEVIPVFQSVRKELIAKYKNDELVEFRKTCEINKINETWDEFINRLALTYDQE